MTEQPTTAGETMTTDKTMTEPTCYRCGWTGAAEQIIQGGLNYEMCPQCETLLNFGEPMKTDEQKRIEQLEKKLSEYREWCLSLVNELSKRGIPVPEKPGKEKVRR
jgi:uncharacterized Zn finger protein (UPF0148 family)